MIVKGIVKGLEKNNKLRKKNRLCLERGYYESCFGMLIDNLRSRPAVLSVIAEKNSFNNNGTHQQRSALLHKLTITNSK